MKICEYDHICCPSCRESHPKYQAEAGHALGLEEGPKVIIRGGGVEKQGHLIRCLSCGLDFVIPCED